MERELTLRELLAAGVHFGHRRIRWNPKMAPYVYGERDGIHIINLEKTVEKLSEACDYLQDVATRGGVILFVGTKNQAAQVVREEAIRCGMPYITTRWLGGTLTNFSTIKKQIVKLEKLEAEKGSEAFLKLSKKDRARTDEEIIRLTEDFGGFRNMKKLPTCIFIVDAHKEKNAVREARNSKIPVVAIVDTNADPDEVKIPVPANDDATSSIKFITSIIADAILEGEKAAGITVVVQPETIAEEEGEVNLAAEARAREEQGVVEEEKIIGEKEKDEGKKRVIKVGRDKE